MPLNSKSQLKIFISIVPIFALLFFATSLHAQSDEPAVGDLVPPVEEPVVEEPVSEESSIPLEQSETNPLTFDEMLEMRDQAVKDSKEKKIQIQLQYADDLKGRLKEQEAERNLKFNELKQDRERLTGDPLKDSTYITVARMTQYSEFLYQLLNKVYGHLMIQAENGFDAKPFVGQLVEAEDVLVNIDAEVDSILILSSQYEQLPDVAKEAGKVELKTSIEDLLKEYGNLKTDLIKLIKLIR